MDFGAFVTLVSMTRLEVLGVALALTIVLGILGALKSKSFKWGLVASFLEPSLNFFWLILGYIGTAAVSAWLLPESVEPATVITTYTVIVIAMVSKIKDQLSYLAPGLPILNWRLPLESQQNK